MDYSQFKQVEFRRKFFKLFGAVISATDVASGKTVAHIKMKAFKLKEDIRVFTDASEQTEVMRIQARQLIDFGATYDIIDSASGQAWMSIRRQGLKSTFVRDHWDLQDANGNIFGSVEETSSNLALVRRYIDVIPIVGELISLVFSFIPQTYSILVNQAEGKRVVAGTILHRRNPFIVKMLLDMSGVDGSIDTRIGIAVTSLLAVVDANKNS